MRLVRFALFLLIPLVPPLALHGADAGTCGYAKSTNFTVLTPRQPTSLMANHYAEGVLQQAEKLRREIALEWLDTELPPSKGRTLISVSFHAGRDDGLTWAKDDPRRRYHMLYLTTPPNQSISSNTLAHEMVHIVLATEFPHPHRLPAWIEEGIASRFDDDERKLQRQQEMNRFINSRNWPSIIDVFEADNLQANDTQAYTVAVSITSLLLERDNQKDKFYAFGLFVDSMAGMPHYRNTTASPV